MEKQRAPRNRTLYIDEQDRIQFSPQLSVVNSPLTPSEVENKIYNSDLFHVLDFFPNGFADLIFIDPPYNLDKNFNGFKFSKGSDEEYLSYLHSWFPKVIAKLKPNGSLYICGDWKNTGPLYQIMKEFLILRNRITWQREKGRGAKSNWKNCTEDIWFGTNSEDYYFNVDAVKQKRRVIAPYKENGVPKDWEETEDGNFRLTHPSNFWDDITIPYWSMPENTDHPTQKPEKLLAKLILASCPENGLVFDPFLGSGTTSVVARKLNRKFCGIEINKEYCLLTIKRLEMAILDKTIQGYNGGVFWERNTLSLQEREKPAKRTQGHSEQLLFGVENEE